MILIKKLKKYQPNHQVKLINGNILQVKKYYLQIKKKQNKLNILINCLKKPFKSKQKRLKTKVVNKMKQFKIKDKSEKGTKTSHYNVKESPLISKQ